MLCHRSHLSSTHHHPRTTEYGYKSYRLQNGGTGAVDSR